MIKLKGYADLANIDLEDRSLLTVTSDRKLPKDLRSKHAYLVSSDDDIPEGFSVGITFDKKKKPNKQAVIFDEDLNHLRDGDIIRVSKNGDVSVLYRRESPNNTILLTYRCNHYCIMCSQPPRNNDDSWILEEAVTLLGLIPKDTKNIGFSGGEPTLYREKFADLLNAAKKNLPNTAIDVLTNGRSFSNFDYAKLVGSVEHPDCLFGIPLYADDSNLHDYIVQSKGAFHETVRGIINLKEAKQKVEIRVVLQKDNIKRLVQLCEYISRNLLFVDHVALMGLEMMGFAKSNMNLVWIDPIEYKDILSDAVAILSSYNINLSVYNHQLCVVNKDTYSFCKKSISDWKREYVDECNLCSLKDSCGGFFFSSKLYRYSDHIRAIY